jgi:hypothetical protein
MLTIDEQEFEVRLPGPLYDIYFAKKVFSLSSDHLAAALLTQNHVSYNGSKKWCPSFYH